MQIFGHDKRIHVILLYGAYSWLLLSGFMQFGIDVVAQYVRGKRVPSDATTLYYGLNTAYAFSQILFAVLALFAIRKGLTAMGEWSGITLGFVAACVWLALCLVYLEYPQPRITLAFYAILLAGAALT